METIIQVKIQHDKDSFKDTYFEDLEGQDLVQALKDAVSEPLDEMALYTNIEYEVTA